QVPALAAIESQHAERIANTECALAEGLDEVSCDLQLAARGAKTHRRGHIHDCVHGYARSLPIYADQPLLLNVPQAGAQIAAPRIGPVVQTLVRDEFLTCTQAGSAMRAGSPSADAAWQPIVKLALFAHGLPGRGHALPGGRHVLEDL